MNVSIDQTEPGADLFSDRCAIAPELANKASLFVTQAVGQFEILRFQCCFLALPNLLYPRVEVSHGVSTPRLFEAVAQTIYSETQLAQHLVCDRVRCERKDDQKVASVRFATVSLSDLGG